jgi:hypothetical protein
LADGIKAASSVAIGGLFATFSRHGDDEKYGSAPAMVSSVILRRNAALIFIVLNKRDKLRQQIPSEDALSFSPNCLMLSNMRSIYPLLPRDQPAWQQLWAGGAALPAAFAKSPTDAPMSLPASSLAQKVLL